MQDRYQLTIAAGEDEEARLRSIVEEAHRLGCVAVSVNGAMWRKSRGRTIAIHVGGDEDSLLLFKLGSTSGLGPGKRLASGKEILPR